MKNLNRAMTNEELKEAAAKSLEGGAIVIIDHVETTNPDYVNIYAAQYVNDLPIQSTTKVSDFQAKALGWDKTPILMRVRFNSTLTFAAEHPVGSVIEDAKIRVSDSFEKEWEEQGPRISKEGEIRQKDGQPIYRHTEVLTLEEFEAQGHSTISYDSVKKAEAPANKGVKEKELSS